MELPPSEGAARPLPENIRRQALLFDTLLDAVVITDLEGRIVDWNRAAEGLYGYRREEVLGKESVEVLKPTDGMAMHEEILRALHDRGRWEGEIRFVRSDGSEGCTETVVIAQRDEEGKLLWQVGVNRDVTQRKLAEAALRRSEEQLRQAQKMEAVGRLAGGIAHDFNNLLTAIRGNVELAIADLPAESPVHTELEQIRHAAETATAVTRQLLSFSRQQAAVPLVIDLAASVEKLTVLLKRLLGSDLELETRMERGVGHVCLDPAHLEQILINLALNARHAMPEGGRLTVTADSVVLGPGHPALPMDGATGDYVRLTVADSGVGIDEQTRPRIFEPFFTTRQDGSGLGLFTVYGIVTQNGGSIAVESAPGEGTTFTIHLPRVAPATPERSAEAVAEAAAATAETVLLVEDEDAVRLMANKLLQRRGYRVLLAENGEEALRVAGAHPGSIEVLLTDMTMPRMSGLELARRMSERYPGIPIVFMSGYTEQPVPDGLIGESPTLFIHKPFSLDVLIQAIRDAVALRSR